MLKNTKFYSFTKKIKIEEYIHEDLGPIKSGTLDQEMAIRMSFSEGAIISRVYADRFEYVESSGYVSFMSGDDIAFQLSIASGFIVFDESVNGDYITAAYADYGYDVLSGFDDTTLYPLFRVESEQATSLEKGEPQMFTYGDIFVKISNDDEWQRLFRVSEATYSIFNLTISRVIGELELIKQLFKLARDKGTMFLINDKLYTFNSYSEDGMVFNPVKVYDYMNSDELVVFSYMELARLTTPVIGKDTFLVLNESIVLNGTVVDDMDEISPIINPAANFNESLMYKFNFIFNNSNTLNTMASNRLAPYQEILTVYRELLKNLKDVKKSFDKIVKKIDTSIYGTRPVFVAHKFGISYSISKEELEKGIELFNTNIQSIVEAIAAGENSK